MGIMDNLLRGNAREVDNPLGLSNEHGMVRVEYGTLVDGEPVFVLRASAGPVAQQALRAYIEGAREPAHKDFAERAIERFESWQRANRVRG
jgi:hypothetical protein